MSKATRELLGGERLFVIRWLLTPEECEGLIRRSEAIGYQAATLGGGTCPGVEEQRARHPRRSGAGDLALGPIEAVPAGSDQRMARNKLEPAVPVLSVHGSGVVRPALRWSDPPGGWPGEPADVHGLSERRAPRGRDTLLRPRRGRPA